MNQYTIYCTPEQTKKALELGVPIEIEPYDNPYCVPQKYPKIIVKYPTAEQMIGWLEEQRITSIEITFSKETKWKFEFFSECYDFDAPYNSRKEATLAAIDAALEYLADNNLIK